MKILVKSDVFDICNRIKKFDYSYRIVYDNCQTKYEIYSTKLGMSVELISGIPLSYVCSLPYSQLDNRTIKYLYDTSVDNMDNIIKIIENENDNIENSNKTKLINQSLLIAENKLRQLT